MPHFIYENIIDNDGQDVLAAQNVACMNTGLTCSYSFKTNRYPETKSQQRADGIGHCNKDKLYSGKIR